MNRSANASAGREDPGYLLVLPWAVQRPGGVSNVVINLFREALKDGKFRPLVLTSSWEDEQFRRENLEAGCYVYYRRLRSPWSRQVPVKAIIGYIATFPQLVADLSNFL